MVLLPYRSPSPRLYSWDCSFISIVVISISVLSEADQKCQSNWKTPTHQFIVHDEKHQAVKSTCPIELEIGKPYMFKVCLSETLSPRSNFTIDIYQQSYNFQYIYAPCYEFNYTIPAHNFNVSVVSSSDCFKYLETTCYVYASIVWRKPTKQPQSSYNSHNLLLIGLIPIALWIVLMGALVYMYNNKIYLFDRVWFSRKIYALPAYKKKPSKSKGRNVAFKLGSQVDGNLSQVDGSSVADGVSMAGGSVPGDDGKSEVTGMMM